jgi:dTMP kinase
MRPNETNGLLITFCGLDGCGKTTMIRKLMADLEKEYSIFLTKQPTDFVRQSAIFRTYMDCPNHNDFDYRSLSLLAASDRIQHSNKVIELEMEKGNIVLSDRYFYSCLANLRARGFKADQWIYEIAESIVKPDIAFFFDVPVEKAVSRVRSREAEKNRYIDMELQYKLHEEYRKICEMNNGILVSTELSVEESYKTVKEAVERVLKNECRRKSN